MCNEIYKDNLKYLNRFLGYGNPWTARIFFFGIEEHGEFTYEEFIERKNENCRYKIPDISPSNGRTEHIQSSLTYRILSQVLHFQMPCTEEEFKIGFNVPNYMFCSNLYPIGSSRESYWSNTNIIITGYQRKSRFKRDCLDGTGNFQGITSRKESLKRFLKFIKRRMQRDSVWIFVNGYKRNDILSPGEVFKELFTDVFGLTANQYTISENLHLTNYLGNSMLPLYGNKIWITPHPTVLSYNDVNIIIDTILQSKY